MSDDQPAWRPSPWQRLTVIAVLQLPLIALILFSPHPAALWTAGLTGSVICCAGTDSGWRWLNRCLVCLAVLWLLVPLLFAR